MAASSERRGAGAHVLLLLGTAWDALEHHNTRWSAVARRWAADPRVASLTVLGYPRFSLRSPQRAARWEELPTWLDGSRAGRVDVLAHRSRTTPLDGPAWRLAAGRVAAAAGRRFDLALSATPLWNPLLLAVPARRRGFDGVDDWREYDAAAPALRRVEAGYRLLPRLDALTFNTSELASRLAPGDRRARVVPNGVDLGLFGGGGPAPPGLPDAPFAVYVGVVQDRVDLDLLCSLPGRLDGMRVVVAGPGPEPVLDRLRRAGVVTLGRVDHRLVPGLLGRAALGLLPHRVNRFTASMDPLKLLEFLAAGLPVVSTPVAGAAVSSRVVVAAGADEFAAAARRAAALGRLDGPDPAVADRDWGPVADRLLTTHLGPAAA